MVNGINYEIILIKREKRGNEKMKRQILRKIITTTIACVMMMTTLTACGGGKGNVKTAKEPVPASKAFNQEGVWFYIGNDGIISKDEIISDTLVFDGKGNVTSYQCNDGRGNRLTLADLKELSEDEIVTLAKEQDKKIFDERQKAEADDIQKTIDSRQGTYDREKEELDSKSYKSARGLGAFCFYSDEDFSSNPKVIAEVEEYYNEQLTETDNQIKELTSRKEAIDKLEYKEPVAQPFALHVKTDNSGNATQEENISYTYSTVSWGNEEKTAGYSDSEESIKLYFDYGLGTVYDMNFRGFSSMVTLVSEDHAGFMMDTPDTKGIEVD